ncbi:Short chain dehydrogenases/reductase notP' [Exophiala dermatitidis]
METAPRDILPQFDHRNGHMNGVHTSKGRHTRDLFLLDGRSIIVTGATGGLGLQIVKGILESGADVLAIDRVDTPKNNPRWDDLTTTAKKNGTILTYHKCDISDPHSTKAAFNEAVSQARYPLRGLVNCAGIGTVNPSISFDMDEARKIIEVNLLGTMICAQAAARLIQQQNHNLPASFVFIASMSGYVVNKGTPVAAYAASKAGVQQLARNLASEWGGNTEVAFCNSTKEEEKQAEGSSDFPPSIIRVNTVSPGVIRTPMTAGVLTHEHLERLWTDQTMLKRLSVPEDYVGPVLFLLSDASAYVTGADLLVDGGYTHW